MTGSPMDSITLQLYAIAEVMLAFFIWVVVILAGICALPVFGFGLILVGLIAVGYWLNDRVGTLQDRIFRIEAERKLRAEARYPRWRG